MSDKEVMESVPLDLHKTFIPVRADCGHVFPVSVIRMVDGAEFSCPECGQVDRIDEEALADAKIQLASREDADSRNLLDILVGGAMIARGADGPQ